MRASEKRFQEAGSKRVGEPDVGQGWPVFEEYLEEHVETEDGRIDILLDAVVKPVRMSRPRGMPADMRGVKTGENWHDAEKRSVKWYIAPITQHKDLFLKFARYIPSRPVEMEEALKLVRAWVSEYGVLGLAGVDDDSLHPGRRESVRGFWKAASDAEMILDLYEAAIPKKPDHRLSEVLMRWEPGQGWNRFSVDVQREYALKYVGDKVCRVLKSECYPLIYREVNKAKKTQGFTYDFGFRSLLGAMYLQMMLLLTDANNVRQCQRPGCYRTISPGSRKDKIYCSEACKQWFYDNKKP
jgi:hypothetical protein